MKTFNYESIESTNDQAKILIENTDEIVVTADFQSKGRGRREKPWIGNPGENVYYSYAINHRIKPPFRNVSLYQVIGALAVKKSLIELTKADIFKLKYPNDIMALVNLNNYAKLSGVLAEHTFNGNELSITIIGIGVNINQSEFDKSINQNVTSLKNLGYDFQPSTIISKLTDIIKYYLNMDETTLFGLYKNELQIEGKIVLLLKDNKKYQVDSMNSDCRLNLIAVDSGEEIKISDGDSIRYDL